MGQHHPHIPGSTGSTSPVPAPHLGHPSPWHLAVPAPHRQPRWRCLSPSYCRGPAQAVPKHPSLHHQERPSHRPGSSTGNACPQPVPRHWKCLFPPGWAALEGLSVACSGKSCPSLLSSCPPLLSPLLLLSSAPRRSHTMETFPTGSPPSLRPPAVLMVLQYSCSIDIRCTRGVFSMYFGLHYSMVNSLKIKKKEEE